VKTLSGRKLAFEMEGSSTIGDLKNKLTEKEQIPTDQIRLISEGRILANDDQSIEDAKLKPNVEIMMILHLRG